MLIAIFAVAMVTVCLVTVVCIELSHRMAFTHPLSLFATLAQATVHHHSPSSPVFEPEVWNEESVIELRNCLVYASDIKPCIEHRAYWKVPVVRTGDYPPRKVAKAELISALYNAGIVPARFADLLETRQNRWLVLVGIADGDFHLWRLDRDGQWSHKPGGLPARRSNGNPFWESCGSPYRFVGFFWTTPHTAFHAEYEELVSESIAFDQWVATQHTDEYVS